MKKKILKIAFCLLAALLVLGSCFSLFARQTSFPEDSSQTSGQVLTPDEYEQRFHELAKERYEELKKKSKSCLGVAHADGLTSEQIVSETRYTDKFLNSNVATGVGLGVQVGTALVDVAPAGENIELRFKSFYEVTGKVRLLYQAYVDGRYQTLFTETVTCYCLFVPEGAYQWFNGTLTPPDMPEWSLEGINPNDMCFERALDTDDKSYFIARLYDPSTQSCTATNYSGSSEFGVRFNFYYNNGRVIDQNGTHTFNLPSNHPIDFVSSEVNSIDKLQSQTYYPDDLVYSSNLTVALEQLFYCSYVITNDRPENTAVISENIYQTYNNYDFRKFPIYRITNENYQSYDTYNDYTVKYYNQTYVDNGLSIDTDSLKSTIDYDTLYATVSAPLELEFQSLFDDIYSLQPDIGLNFNIDNNTFDYPSIVNPSPPSSGWQPPSYPAVNTSVYIPAEVPTYQTYALQTIPDSYISGTGDWFYFAYDLFDGLGLLVFIVPLVILGLFWRFTGGD